MNAADRRFGTAVLTGATSGIGEATARLLATRADTLVIHGPEPTAEAARLLADLRAIGEARVHYVEADFTRLDAVARAAREIHDLAPNASICSSTMPGCRAPPSGSSPPTASNARCR